MSRNAFSPPAAPVADFEIDSDEIPRNVVIACRLMWLSCGFAELKVVIAIVGEIQKSGEIPRAVGQIFACAIGVAIYAWFISKLKRRRNWMRVLLNVLLVVGLLAQPFILKAGGPALLSTYANNPLLLAATIARYALDITYVALLNMSRSRAWFTRKETGRLHST
jgi:hypothetical protein